MRIHGEKIIIPGNLPAVKKSGGAFGQMFSRHIKPQPFSALVRDAFTDAVPQAADEVEKICADETGENINMQDLDDLLNIIINERDGKNDRRN